MIAEISVEKPSSRFFTTICEYVKIISIMLFHHTTEWIDHVMVITHLLSRQKSNKQHFNQENICVSITTETCLVVDVVSILLPWIMTTYRPQGYLSVRHHNANKQEKNYFWSFQMHKWHSNLMLQKKCPLKRKNNEEDNESAYAPLSKDDKLLKHANIWMELSIAAIDKWMKKKMKVALGIRNVRQFIIRKSSRFECRIGQRSIYYTWNIQRPYFYSSVKRESEYMPVFTYILRSVYAVWFIYWFKSIDYFKHTRAFSCISFLISFNSLELHYITSTWSFIEAIQSSSFSRQSKSSCECEQNKK